MKKITVFAFAGLVMCAMTALDMAGPAGNAQAATTFVTIGTGGVTGVYYPTGGAISKIVNQKRKEYGLRVTVESTGGSVFNINAVMSGDLEFGIAQSDRQYQAVKGLAEWEGTPQKKLRAVCSIHPESITLAAAGDSNIMSLEDLKGATVNLGNPGSGQRQNALDVLGAFGIDPENDLSAESLKAAEAPKMLQDGRIDAFFYTVGHPNGAFKEATSGRREVRFIPIDGSELDTLIEKYPYYARSVIDMGNYPQALNDEDVKTLGVKATLVTSADVPDDVVYAVTKEIFENLDVFKTLHPAYSVLTRENMLEGLSAPIHPGAMKYYKEVGMM
ncbi:C4-dicarboxylate ABC transporter substrate-binding protein [candidate division KSB3 bacterium]|uniref:C4-dicarboxylate ABC transporter substrate-binding protein n=1 Tax=candidate division KSB3 bacterium TaxID=2044937 RepID=A0A2G6E837_9BACT|nr:MAG: C4-dicarboxylate ABC transporter substrate-binding protein [candidate division KSB3 bacterium]PIE30396.1 MAG: C4-dicarboxylate ABC transporter substrate-binding protein [candidate division KSB3 bacterium]